MTTLSAAGTRTLGALRERWERDAPRTPGLRVMHQVGLRRPLVALALTALAFNAIITLVEFRPDLANPTTIGSDTSNYYAAGQRLNDGHPLYALSPGDRTVPLDPPYYSVPLLSPPPIAALWRPLALLGDTSMWLWWLAMLTVVAVVTLALVATGPPRVLAGVFLVAPAVGMALWSGNMQAILIALLAGTWVAWARGHSRLAGVLVGIAAGLKLLPILLAWWFLVRRDVRGIQGVVAGGLAVAAIGLLGAGIANHVAYLSVIGDTTSGGATLYSVAGFLGSEGVPMALASKMALVFVAGCLAAIWLLRARPRASFAMAVVTVLYASPVVLLGNYAILLGALVPWTVAIRRRDVADAPSGVTDRTADSAGRPGQILTELQ